MGVHKRGQAVDLNRYGFGSIHGLAKSLRNNDGNRLAHIADLVSRHHSDWCNMHWLSVSTVEHRDGGYATESGCLQIFGREDSADAGHRPGCSGIDPQDLSMGLHGAYKYCMTLLRKLDVLCVSALACDKGVKIVLVARFSIAETQTVKIHRGFLESDRIESARAMMW
jgi:hypothetical protein